MLMLIGVYYTIKRHKAYFNTSHVNVNRLDGAVLTGGILNFNTSHVNVNLISWVRHIVSTEFQYISC